MSEKTKIAWTDSTVNFFSGCTKVSPGCANCYAEALSNRKLGHIGKWGKGAPRQLHESAFKLAFNKLNKKPWLCDICGASNPYEFGECDHGRTTSHRRRIFSLSLGDWLDDEVPIEWLARMLDTIRQCDQVTWILCTKRPENFFNRLGHILASANEDAFYSNNEQRGKLGIWLDDWLIKSKRPSNIILLISVENQEQADKRIPELLKIPAACRGLSLEPLLGPVDILKSWKPASLPQNARAGKVIKLSDQIHWLIIGGESGPHARPCNVEWIRSLVEQGRTAGVATFVKQLGAHPYNGGKDDVYAICAGTAIFYKDKKGGDPAEWPEDLRIQEFPKGF